MPELVERVPHDFRRFWVAQRIGDHSVYRIYDHNNNLLYVGISVRVRSRVREHYLGAPWRLAIHRVEVEHGLTKGQALVAEREAIISEAPIHNHTKYPPKKGAGYVY